MIKNNMHDENFEDIRPYRDHEFKEVIDRITNHEWIVASLRSYIWSGCPEFLYPVLDFFIRIWVRTKLASVHTIDDFQRKIVRKYVLTWSAKKTTAGLTYSGEEHLISDKSVLYITNHRDIALDSSYLCLLLLDFKMTTPEIAFGDNLLINDLTSDLIRINKSFIVKRNLSIREQVRESYKLSRYIFSTLQKNHSVWLAQRAGRSKDGNDLTNPSIIKMLYLSQRKGGMPFSDFINSLRIMPVAISYELDPCDEMKAKELWKIASYGSYIKKPKADLISILRGISGWKGRVHYSFTPVLKGKWRDINHVAQTIDRAIHQAYRLWPGNYIAYDALKGTSENNSFYTEKEKQDFLDRFSSLTKEVREIALKMYANPFINKKILET